MFQEDLRAQRDFLLHLAEEVAEKPGAVDVLEVGGGSRTTIQLPEARYVSLDVDEKSLARSSYAQTRIVGDAQDYDFRDMSFDVAVFWNVLEHIPDPRQALDNVAGTVRPDGAIVVAGPLLKSLKAIVTRLSPHWAHVLFYRVVCGKKQAGTPGQGPFKVEHSKGCDIDDLVALLRERGFQVSFRREFQGCQLRRLSTFSRVLYRVYQGLSWTLRQLSFGRLGSVESDFILVARKVPQLA